MSGREFAHYLISASLGAGGMGEVYRALAKEMPPSSLPIANGARLGWLLEPRANCGTIYRLARRRN